MKETSRGSFAIPVEWTDRGVGSAKTEKTVLDFHCLTKLAELVSNCRNAKKKVFDK